MHTRIRRNDTVVVIAGRERGKSGKVLRVLPEKERAVVEHLNMIKRHSKGRGGQTAQGIIEREAPIHISNLMILCEKCSAPVRTGKKALDDGRTVRVCRRCGDQVDR